MKTLVTGANGFVGRSLCEKLAARGDRVFAIHRPGGTGTVLPNLEWIECDLARPGFEDRLPRELDAVVYLAQSARFREFPAGARDMFDVNLQATFNLLEFSRNVGAKRFLYASSGGVYGQGMTAFSELDPLIIHPSLGFYLSSKLAAEVLVDNFSGLLSTAILRIFFAYGPGQQSDRLIPRLLNNVRTGKPISLSDKNGLAINPIYIDDVVELFVRAIDHAGSLKVNVAGREILTLNEIGTIIGKKIGRKAIFEINEDPNPQKLVGDISTMIAALQYSPRVTFEDGVTRMMSERGDS